MAVKEDAGLSQGTIAVSAFRVYRNALLGPGADKTKGTHTDWDDLDDDQQAAWFSVAERSLEVLDDCENLAWVSFASSIFVTWAKRIDYPVQDFGELADAPRAAWVAVARHIANLCALENDEDLASHEERWIGAAGRLGKQWEPHENSDWTN